MSRWGAVGEWRTSVKGKEQKPKAMAFGIKGTPVTAKKNHPSGKRHKKQQKSLYLSSYMRHWQAERIKGGKAWGSPEMGRCGTPDEISRP